MKPLTINSNSLFKKILTKQNDTNIIRQKPTWRLYLHTRLTLQPFLSTIQNFSNVGNHFPHPHTGTWLFYSSPYIPLSKIHNQPPTPSANIREECIGKFFQLLLIIKTNKLC